MRTAGVLCNYPFTKLPNYQILFGLRMTRRGYRVAESKAILCRHISPEPIHPQLKLYGIDPWIGHGKPGVGDVLIANVEGDGALLPDEEMKAQCGMSYKVDGRGVERYLRAREQHSSP